MSMNLVKDREEILKKISAFSGEYVVVEGHELHEYEENRITVLVDDAKKFCQQVLGEPENYMVRHYVESGRYVDVYVMPRGKSYFPVVFETRLFASKIKHKMGFFSTVKREVGLIALYRNVVHFRKYDRGERYAYLEMLRKAFGDQLNVPPKRKNDFSSEVIVPA